MDRICGAVLKKIEDSGERGKYAILAGDELLDAFPEGSEKTYNELERALGALTAAGYIDLKYSRGDMYCVAPLKEYTEEPQESAPERKKARLKLNPAFLPACLGGALGSAAVTLIFALIGLC